MIKSPYSPNEISEDAIIAFHSVTRLSGADDFFVVTVGHKGKNIEVKTASSIISEGLVMHLRSIADEMEQTLNEKS